MWSIVVVTKHKLYDVAFVNVVYVVDVDASLPDQLNRITTFPVYCSFFLRSIRFFICFLSFRHSIDVEVDFL